MCHNISGYVLSDLKGTLFLGITERYIMKTFITATIASAATAATILVIRKMTALDGIKKEIESIESNFAEIEKCLNNRGFSVEDDYEYNQLKKLYEEHLKIKCAEIKFSELDKLNERVIEYCHIRFTQG